MRDMRAGYFVTNAVTYIHLAMFTACERLCPYNRLVAKNPFAQPAIVGVIYIVSPDHSIFTRSTCQRFRTQTSAAVAVDHQNCESV